MAFKTCAMLNIALLFLCSTNHNLVDAQRTSPITRSVSFFGLFHKPQTRVVHHVQDSGTTSHSLVRANGVLIRTTNSCGDRPPTHLRAAIALRCDSTIKTRQCMALPDDAPLFKGTDCKGDSCLLTLDHVGTKCILESTGVSVDPQNQTRSATCGLDREDSHWFERMVDPTTSLLVDSGARCGSSLPANVVAHAWVDCVDGAPMFRLSLTFKQPFTDGSYTCALNPQCSTGKYTTTFACYATSSPSIPVVLHGYDSPTSKAGTYDSGIWIWVAMAAFVLFWWEGLIIESPWH